MKPMATAVATRATTSASISCRRRRCRRCSSSFLAQMTVCAVFLFSSFSISGRSNNQCGVAVAAFKAVPTSRQQQRQQVNLASTLITTTTAKAKGTTSATTTRTTTALGVHLDRDPTYLESIVGGERYELNELPDSMMDTTIFVGNLNEFCGDEDLAQLFQSVSALQTSPLPATVVRKPDSSSLQYGFVSFLSATEAQTAIVRFHNTMFMGRRIKVQEILDIPGRGRVRIPEKMIAFVIGGQRGPVASSSSSSSSSKKKKKKINASSNAKNSIYQKSLRRVSTSQVGHASSSSSSSSPTTVSTHKNHPDNRHQHRLNDQERAEMERAIKKGFLTLVGNRRQNSSSSSSSTTPPPPLAHVHCQWCNDRRKPQICVYKATTHPLLDQVVIDLAPLGLYGLLGDAGENNIQVEDYIVRWKAEMLIQANFHGMQLCKTRLDNNDNDNDDDDEEKECCDIDSKMTDLAADDNDSDCCLSNESSSTPTPTACLQVTEPFVSQKQNLSSCLTMVFQGERSHAKAMAKALAIQWDIPDKQTTQAGKTNNARKKKNSSKTKKMELLAYQQQPRRRGGGHRQAWD